MLWGVRESLDYLDLGGYIAPSLDALGGSAALWKGLTKLYASGSSLESLDGIEKLSRSSHLYLDNNLLSRKELLRLKSACPCRL